ncbi:hypothetical protein [Fundidesulfovibrio terrae]|nr:hypothetical protein [Fundidesulfovibrio terrae]
MHPPFDRRPPERKAGGSLDPCEAHFRGIFVSDAVNEDAGVLWS